MRELRVRRTISTLDTPRIKATKPRGAHPDKRFTAVTVRNLTRPGRYADGNGLYLFVDASGAKRWVLRTVIGGKRRDIGLGSVRLITLAEARDEATRMRRMARRGQDPLAERRRATLTVPTFKEAAETVHEAHAKTFKNDASSGEKCLVFVVARDELDADRHSVRSAMGGDRDRWHVERGPEFLEQRFAGGIEAFRRFAGDGGREQDVGIAEE